MPTALADGGLALQRLLPDVPALGLTRTGDVWTPVPKVTRANHEPTTSTGRHRDKIFSGLLARGDSVEEVVHERVDERRRDRLVRDEKTVVDGAPELVDQDADVDVRADLTDVLGVREPPVGELAPGAGVQNWGGGGGGVVRKGKDENRWGDGR
ncbi:hypothetical protein ACWDR1_33035, partial [Streptosporangium sandarakinum]